MAVSRTGRKSGKLVHHIFVTSLGPSHTFFIYFQNFPFFCGLFDRQQKSPPRALTLNLRHEPRAPFKMKKKKNLNFAFQFSISLWLNDMIDEISNTALSCRIWSPATGIVADQIGHGWHGARSVGFRPLALLLIGQFRFLTTT